MKAQGQPLRYECNVCGTPNDLRSDHLHRELSACLGCGANMRMRGIVRAIQDHFLDQPKPALTKTSPVKSVRGIGMSDSDSYAHELARVFNYVNTYYHAEPYLDVTSAESAARYRNLDFIICSDVLEHVLAPVSLSLVNLRSMLKRDGKLLLTVPYVEGYESIEHYPQLNNFQIVNIGAEYMVVNARPDGRIETFANPVFHGGPGAVLELRIFGEGDLFAMLDWAGFRVDVFTPQRQDIGYVWEPGVESLNAHGRRSKSYVLICTAK